MENLIKVVKAKHESLKIFSQLYNLMFFNRAAWIL
jgi:hypothetical protein